MKFRRTSQESIPGDGLIVLAPGAGFGFDVDAPLVPSIEQLRQRIFEIRGLVLSNSFAIENEFILLALADEFGSNSRDVAIA